MWGGFPSRVRLNSDRRTFDRHDELNSFDLFSMQSRILRKE